MIQLSDNIFLHHGDCLDIMPKTPVVDAVITDPPYGTTACKWDSVIPFDAMWGCIKNVVKPKAAIALFGSQPFTSALVMSNPKWFRYQWIWKKSKCGNFQIAAFQPLKYTEDIIVFSKETPRYYPVFREAPPATKNRRRYSYEGSKNLGGIKHMASGEYQQKFVNGKDKVNPTNIIELSNEINNVHPTQKPVELMEYLIKTYTEEGQTVLDFTMGIGSTGVACANLNRGFIGIEKDKGYFDIAVDRIGEALDNINEKEGE